MELPSVVGENCLPSPGIERKGPRIMTAKNRSFLSKWVGAMVGGKSPSAKSNRISPRLGLEALEKRENPAFNITIGVGPLANITPTINGSVVTMTPTANDATIGISDLTGYLTSPSITEIIIPTSTNGAQAGDIVWTGGTLSAIGLGMTKQLTLVQSASTKGGVIDIDDYSISGNALNGITLNLIGDATDVTSSPTGIRMSIGQLDNGITNLNVTAYDTIEVNQVQANGSISISTSSMNLIDGLIAGNSPSILGTITLQGSTNIDILNNTNYLLLASGQITVGGGVQSLNNTGLNLQSDTAVVINAPLGDVGGLAPIGQLLLSGPGDISINSKITADSILIDPLNPNFDLTMGGGAIILNINTAGPTVLDNNGSLTIGAGPTDYYVFGGGFNAPTTLSDINLSGTIASLGQPISIGNLVLQTNGGIDTTNKGVSPLGGNITLGQNNGSITGINNLVSLSLNAGSGGTTTVVPAVANLAQVIVQNSASTNFQGKVNITNLNIQQPNGSINFQNTAAVGQIQSSKTTNAVINFQQKGAVAGPLFGAVDINKGGTGSSGNTTLTIANGQTGSNYIGTFSVSNGILQINQSFPTTSVVVNGGVFTGLGTVGAVTTATAAAKVINPGAPPNAVGTLRVTTVNLGPSTTAQFDLQTQGQLNNDRIVASTGVILSGASLQVSLVKQYYPVNGSRYTIINNGSLTPVAGTFFGLPEGSTFSAGGASFVITYAGGDGNDVVVTAINTGVGNTGYVNYLYSTILNRAADPAGQSNYVGLLDGGAARQTVVNAIWNSAEHRVKQVQSWYTKFLGRSADFAGLNNYVNQLLSGKSQETVMTQILISPEYQLKNPPVTAYVNSLFQNLLNRPPTAPELASWSNIMLSGTSRANVVNAFLFSNEYLGQTVQGFYATYLGRLAGSSGLSFWVSAAKKAGTQAVAAIGILSSEEAYQKATTI